jgi:hypothetical protein
MEEFKVCIVSYNNEQIDQILHLLSEKRKTHKILFNSTTLKLELLSEGFTEISYNSSDFDALITAYPNSMLITESRKKNIRIRILK